ncbi:MAG: T9SS type A sorting domain-containing protein [Bacteroidia bacterium]|nr:T9SS type A sorting domain-containing protein [Bacteroidia bacterium]
MKNKVSKKQIDLKNYPGGVYFLKIISKNETFMATFIVE